MKINFQLQPLTWDNYLDLTKYIDDSDYDLEFWSPIAIMNWIFYGIDFYFHCLENNQGIIFYLRHQRYGDKKWKVSTCFYKKENLNLDLFHNVFKNDLKKLNGNEEIKYNNISEQMIEDFKIDKNSIRKINYISNYIYETDTLKTFRGKKLQKKRNHLNFFLNNYATHIEAKHLNEISDNKILEYCQNHILEFQEKENETEINSYRRLVEIERHKDSNYKGIAVILEDKIVALTMCYLRKNICDILIEKANKNTRGVYQFLVSQNLIINNVNQKYVDREDDNGNEMLTKSKMSYHPIYTIKRYMSNN